MTRNALHRFTIAASLAFLAIGAHAALKPGDAAPTFRTTAALAGKPFDFDMASALKKGPVVLYFYPKAFTKGCTVEAHAFAEATPDFAKLGVPVLGMSHDDIDTLKRFSREACRDQFAVGSDPDGKTIKAYDARMLAPMAMASRISYLIGQDGKVLFTHEGNDPLKHVSEMMKAAKQATAKSS